MLRPDVGEVRLRPGLKILGACGTAVLVAVLLPTIFGQPPVPSQGIAGDPWRSWISEFQTLITGLAAVGAATATIVTMVRTDARQEIRHRELIALSLRSEKLTIERVAAQQLPALWRCHFLIRADVQRICDLPVITLADVERFEREVHEAIGGLQDIFDSSQWIEAKHLFGGELVAEITWVKASFFECEHTLRRWKAVYRDPASTQSCVEHSLKQSSPLGDGYEEKAEAPIARDDREAIVFFESLANSARRLATEIERLTAVYKIAVRN